jgi:hypothetical protein
LGRLVSRVALDAIGRHVARRCRGRVVGAPIGQASRASCLSVARPTKNGGDAWLLFVFGSFGLDRPLIVSVVGPSS